MPDSSPLIGREIALAAALEQLKRIEAGGSRCLLVRGEAGIGKSRLASEVVARARDVGHPVLIGRADEFDRGIPYALFRDVLARLAPPDDEDVASLVQSLRTGLDAGAGAAGAPADAHLRLVFGRAVEAFRALTEGSPTVLLVEDAHLADADSLALLALLARLGELPLLTIATMRPPSAAPVRELERLFERIAEDGRGAVVDLEPLDRHDVQVLVRAVLDAGPDERVVDTVFAQSGGNPFFARETVRALRDSGAVSVEGGVARLGGEVEGLAFSTALRGRVLGSDADAVELAKVVSAFGRFDLRHLGLVAVLTGRSEADVSATFDRLVHEHVLVRGSDGGYEFAHGIVRDAVYDEIGPAERRRLHGAIADELAKARRAGALLDIATLATHVAESADPGDERAVDVLLEAGRTVNATAPLVAAEHYGSAARLLAPDSPRRAEALALRARALHIGSRAVEAAATGREALAALPPGPVRRATVALVVNGLSIAGRISEALEVIEQEISREESTTLLVQRVHMLQSAGRSDEAADLLPEAVAAYRAADGTQLSAATHLLVYAFDAGEMELADELLAQLEEWTRSGAPERRVIAHETIAVLDRRPGVVDSLERHLAAARERRPDPAPPSIGGQYETALALLSLLRGEWDEALALCRSAPFELEQRGAALYAQALRATECEILIDRGAVDDAGAIARGLADLSEEMVTPAVLCRARVRRALGENAEAIELLSAQRERSRERRTNWKRPEVLSELAELLAEEGRLDEARDVALEVAAVAEGPCRFEWPLVALRLRATLWEDTEAAISYLERATAERMPFERARAGLVLGSLDVDPGTHLTEAYRTFDGLGAGPWRRRAATALRTRGLTVPRPAARDGGGGVLTDTEAKLVRLVREGLTNKQIGSALHYSPKTVEVYLSRIYAKTSCASRVELVRAVDEGTVELPAD